jgi:hypothetical protein
MNEGAPFAAWESFYVIVGSSAGALTGLQFVVMALIAESWPKNSEKEVAAFGTPTIVHFCSALLVSAILSAPWPSVGGARGTLAVLGIAGVIYGFITTLRARRAMVYQPVFEDWMWHSILPTIAYLAIAIAGCVLGLETVAGMFAIAGATVLLLFVGIHNAWDTATYVTLTAAARREQEQEAREARKAKSAPSP